MKIILLLIVLLIPSHAIAHSVDAGYVPPPLFGAPKLPPPKERKEPIDKLPEVSKEVTESKMPPAAKEVVTKPRIVREVKEDEQQPSQPINAAPKVEETRTAQPKVKPKAKPAPPPSFSDDKIETAAPTKEEPIDFLKKEEEQKSLVTGPKTMPSNKKEVVEETKLYEAENAEPTSFELKEVAEPETIENLGPIELDQDQFFLTYKTGEKDLAGQNLQTLEAILIPAMLQNKEITINMNAYASPVEGKPNMDRRIALDRGLQIRQIMVEKGVGSHRINLRSHGSNTANQPPDYVEIQLNGV
ncbi:MAG: hypothetical protein AAGB32_01290 [Pseudomonadota bacterium]